MEKEREEVNEPMLQRFSLARKAWVNIILFLVAGAMIVSGICFIFQPGWLGRADIKLYNKGASAYLLSLEMLTATEESPSELPIAQAAAYFEQAASKSKDNRLKSLALYNLGTLMGGDAIAPASGNTLWFGIEEAITKLEQAVIADPNNDDAKYNLELLKKLQAVLVPTSTKSVGEAPGLPDEKGNFAPGMVHKLY